MTTGLAALRSSFDIAYASQASDGQLRENLIILGGTEVNSLTSTILEKVGSAFRLDKNAMTIADSRTRKIYRTEWDVDPLDGASRRDFDHSWFISTNTEGARVARRFRTDYGMIIRTANPFASHKSLVLICGIYGFGTWAGAQLPFDEDFLRRVSGLDRFECLFQVHVHQRQPLKTDVIVLRALPGVATAESGFSVVRRRASRSGSPPPCAPDDSLPAASGDDPSAG